jgi:cytochrome c peroxidase
MKNATLISALFLAIAWQSCKKEEVPSTTATGSPVLPATPYAYYDASHSDSLINHKATLGRVLFYEKRLSLNNSVSCGSCHKQSAGFADNARFSRGLNNELTDRNSMPVMNLPTVLGVFPGIGPGVDLFMTRVFFWDGRERDLRSLVSRPIANHIEMGVDDPSSLIPRLQALPYYPELVKKAFGDEQITLNRLADAVAVFMESIQSKNTKFDEYIAQQSKPGILNAQEEAGYQLFLSKYNCSGCHNPFPGEYNSPEPKNIGLDAYSPDPGMASITGNAADRGKFKVPILRNIAQTAPYMHDGRFKTLEEVIDHYSNGIQDSESLHPLLKNAQGSPLKMTIPDHEKRALIAFLHALTDYQVLSDPKFSDPFQSF